MKLTIVIDMDNSAFEPDDLGEQTEAKGIIDQLDWFDLLATEDIFLRDIKGNRVGFARIER